MHLLPPAHVHLIAICGTAMAALAGMLAEKGFRVTGSDANVYPPMSTLLESLGIDAHKGFDARHLNPSPDLIVVGNAVSRGNPEVEAMLDLRIPYMSLPEAVRELFLRGRRPIVITGTHGKTTTTAMTAHLLDSGGLHPSFLIAGMPANFPRSFGLGAGEFYVIEGDEYDSAFFAKTAKFFHYMPEVLVVNSIEFDHADIYRDLDEIRRAFRQVVNMVPGNGLLLACCDDPEAARLVPDSPAPVETFGLEAGAYWRATDIVDGVGTGGCSPTCEFTVSRHGEPIGRTTLPMLGRFNIRNALAAIAAASYAGVPFHDACSGLASFRGVKRRQEIIGNIDGILLIDDFAHHPTAVGETLSGLRSAHGDRRIWAIFEPASATNARSRFEPQYLEAFAPADHVVVGRVPRPERSRDDEPFSGSRLAARLSNRGTPARHIEDPRELLAHLAEELESGDLVIFMSNGSFAGLQSQLHQALQAEYGM